MDLTGLDENRGFPMLGGANAHAYIARYYCRYSGTQSWFSYISQYCY